MFSLEEPKSTDESRGVTSPTRRQNRTCRFPCIRLFSDWVLVTPTLLPCGFRRLNGFSFKYSSFNSFVPAASFTIFVLLLYQCSNWIWSYRSLGLYGLGIMWSALKKSPSLPLTFTWRTICVSACDCKRIGSFPLCLVVNTQLSPPRLANIFLTLFL